MKLTKNLLAGLSDAARQLMKNRESVTPGQSGNYDAGHVDSTKARMNGAVPDFVADLLDRLGVDMPAGLRRGPLPDPAPGGRQAPRRPAPDAPTQPGGRFLAGSFSNSAGSRAYKLYIPQCYQNEGKPLPLVVMLHGCTQDPDDFAAGTRMNTIAEEKQCLVLYPAQSQSANNSRCWNWFNAADQQRDRGEPSLIAGMTRQVMDEYRIDPQCVYIAGLSAGGAMAMVMGMTYPELYAAVGVHSGLPYAAATDLPSAFAAMQGKSNAALSTRRTSGVHAIVFHGDHDKTVHPRNGDAVMQQATGTQGDALEYQGTAAGGRRYTQTIHRDKSGQPVAEQWLVHGAGHAWSGGSRQGTYTDPSGPDAGLEMMRFFYTQPRRQN